MSDNDLEQEKQEKKRTQAEKLDEFVLVVQSCEEKVQEMEQKLDQLWKHHQRLYNA